MPSLKGVGIPRPFVAHRTLRARRQMPIRRPLMKIETSKGRYHQQKPFPQAFAIQMKH